MQFVRDNIQTVDNFQQLYERFAQVVGARCSMDHLPPYICALCHCPLVNASTLACGHTTCIACLRFRSACWCGSQIEGSDDDSLKRNIVFCNTVQQLLPTQSENVAKFRDLERKYSSGGVLLRALSEVKDKMANFEVPKHIWAIVKARHFLAHEDYAMAAVYARRSIKCAPSLATGWCYLSEILAKQTKFFESLSRLLVVHWLDPYLPHSSKLCDEVFSRSRNYTAKSRSKPHRIDRKLSSTATNGPLTTMPVDEHADEELDEIPSKKPRLDDSFTPSVTPFPPVDDCKSPMSTASDCNSGAGRTIGRVGVNSKRIFLSPRPYPSRRPPLSFSENQNPIEEAEFHPSESDLLDKVTMPMITMSICSSLLLESSDHFYRSKIKLPLRSGDLECPLCLRIYWKPDVTPCGHTYCSNCLERTLDHDPKCPLCKHSLADYYETSQSHKNHDLQLIQIIKRWMPNEYEERLQAAKEDEEEMQKLLPIFVCTLAFPGVPCPLHVFEPRHRLLLRRCIRNRQGVFGMNLPRTQPGDIPFERIGTKLKVRNANYFHDGRVVVDSVGIGRFRVKEVTQIDGYDSASCDQIIDVQPKPSEMKKLLSLSNTVFARANEWFDSLPDDMSAALKRHFGEMPERAGEGDQYKFQDGPAWPWWVLAVIPAEDRIKMHVLAQTSLLKRLLLMSRVITCIINSKNGSTAHPPV